MSIEKFSINIPDNILEDLQSRLQKSKWPGEIINPDWERGTDQDYLKSLISYWQNDYDWRAQESNLNKYPQFKCTVDDIDIHFIHVKGKGPNSIPVILTHGWPDSFLRYHKIIPLLTDPASFGGDPNDSFDVVIPSLPGFGFSSAPKSSGYNNSRIADLWVKLMTEKLNYTKFAAAGGDIGSGVTRYMALNYPELLIGIHLTDVGIIREILTSANESNLTPEELEYKKTAQQWIAGEGGYMNIQSTKPQTVAYGLSDSPIGLAAWIIEKFRSWSGNTGDFKDKFSVDDLLTNIMIYWVTNTIASSAQIYYENTHGLPPMNKITVPTAIALFPDDILLPVKSWVERNLNVSHWKVLPRGGHFTAMEEPKLFAEDFQLFFKSIRSNSSII
ncbi:Pimeloyl-ACP methyl ester carboxylesterase [Pedobacter westerhofensis]|uniref:Pimeloyl-ACP methyl ester carboxylesterase n=1 Tax=Pedobacter westerhofensis TaxID=425512 RepID=A0A521ATZ4_9SPHI|nr:epoxide hydrolase family protein [Pedobacter westerhofensis]SMO38245.1 Pimeloyl-ACP methyl ester carboxylesterase [Pedobacter westerhofensis]